MVEYVLERFLYRLATSPAGREHFVLKGGLLLAQFGARRTTRDIDILGQAFTGDETEIIRRVRAIAATEIDDGVAFDAASLRTAAIRDDGRYHGLRLVMPASIARAQLKLQLDVSLGDPITPEPKLIAYQQLLEAGTFTILGYPLATVIAEKLSTAIELGDLNTRDRDYGDLYRLLRYYEPTSSAPTKYPPHSKPQQHTDASPCNHSARASPTSPSNDSPPTPHGYDAKAQPPPATQQASRTQSR